MGPIARVALGALLIPHTHLIRPINKLIALFEGLITRLINQLRRIDYTEGHTWRCLLGIMSRQQSLQLSHLATRLSVDQS